MLPSIGIVLSVEMIRDGGSLAAAFQGSDGCKYWLFLQVRIIELPSGNNERSGYEKPLILDRLAGTEIPVTWQQAGILLSQMRPLIREEQDHKWLGIMEETVLGEGALPNGVDKRLQKYNGPS